MEGVTLDPKKASDSSDPSAFDPHGETLSPANISPTSSLKMIEIGTTQRSIFQNMSWENNSKQQEHLTKHQGEDFTPSELPCRRSTSPSDAILIKRISVPTLKLNTEDAGLGSVNELTA